MARLGALALVTVMLGGCGGTEVQGIVREESTGEPLSGAVVQVGDATARTDEYGAFELEVDDDAPAVIEVQAEGYEARRVDIDMADGDALPADVGLQKESEERQQTRARFAEEQRRLDAQEEEREAEERTLYESRRDFMNQRLPANRQQTRQDLDDEQRRLEEAEEEHEAEERKLYEARRDFEAGVINTWTPEQRTEQTPEQRTEEGRDDDEANEDAADRVREQDDAARDARDER